MAYEATHRTFAYLYRCAARHLVIAKFSAALGKPYQQTGRPPLTTPHDPKAKGEWTLTGGTFFDCMSCLTFSAMTVEAAVNHISAETIKHWDHFETKLKTKEKLELLAEATGVTIDFGATPFNEFTWLQKFRNTLAHGKTETVTKPAAVSMAEVDAEWMSACTIERAEKGLNAARAMVEYLFLKVLNEDMPMVSLSQGGGTVPWTDDGSSGAQISVLGLPTQP